MLVLLLRPPSASHVDPWVWLEFDRVDALLPGNMSIRTNLGPRNWTCMSLATEYISRAS